jgi:NifU-like protein involved in Fe-S cluster formation
MQPEYSETVMDHFRNPRGVGEVAPPDAEARLASPVHGDELRLAFALEGDRITEVRFRCRGCVVAIAAASVATTLLEGRTIADALALTDDDVVAALDGGPRAICLPVARNLDSASPWSFQAGIGPPRVRTRAVRPSGGVAGSSCRCWRSL